MFFMATSSVAMTLGRYSGAALIGRPLDLSVLAVLDAQDSSAALCLDADVFYGDNRLAKSRVQVTVEKPPSGNTDALIRIRSSSFIDEPVVTFYVRVGCLQKIEKRYVVLAEPGPEMASAGTVPLAKSQAVTGSTPGSVPGSAGAVLDPGAVIAAVALLPRQARVQTDGRKSQRLKAAEVPSTESVRSVRNSARLRLEPLDSSGDRNLSLRPSAVLLRLPDASPQQRLEAAALWRSLSSEPGDIARDAAKLQVLDLQVRSLQLQGQKNVAAFENMNVQLQQARADRYANALVYAMAALLLVAVAALVYFLRRSSSFGNKGRDDLPWWRKNEAFEKGWAGSRRNAHQMSVPSVAAVHNKDEAKSTEYGLDLDLDIDLSRNAPESAISRPMSRPGHVNSVPSLAGRDRSDFSLSMTQPARAVKAEELFDVQQQADFFVSLGQHDQAIELLHNHIDENLQTSALVYLDLFDLYHQLQRNADYEALRKNFNQLFNANIPAFDFYNDSSPGLQAYQGALTRIEALWPSPKVLDVIEESIFRRPDSVSESFDLEAYRELLLLYSMAREINSTQETSTGAAVNFDLSDASHMPEVKHSNFSATSIQPLSARVAEGKKYSDVPMLESVLPPASPRLYLDLDLSQFSSAASNFHPGTESDASFFAQFAADIPVGPPASALAKGGVTNSDSSLSSLFDFDAFDASLEFAHQAKPSKESKTPQV